jgi:hypothetical protein
MSNIVHKLKLYPVVDDYDIVLYLNIAIKNTEQTLPGCYSLYQELDTPLHQLK